MQRDKLKIAFIGLVILFFAILYAFRKTISYPFFTLEKYTGKINRGRSTGLFTIHLFVSFGLCLGCYALLDKVRSINILFNDTFIRLSIIFLLWLVWIIVTGWLIELYLEATDEDYKNWKSGILKNNNTNSNL